MCLTAHVAIGSGVAGCKFVTDFGCCCRALELQQINQGKQDFQLHESGRYKVENSSLVQTLHQVLHHDRNQTLVLAGSSYAEKVKEPQQSISHPGVSHIWRFLVS